MTIALLLLCCTHTYTHTNKKITKEGNVLFNNALNTFYLRLYDVRQMVKDHSDSEREITAARTWATLSIFVYTETGYHGPCFTSRGALAGTRNSSMGPP